MVVFSPDETVAARYRIVRLLGQGGMGAVYEAFDLEFSEAVALKTILPAAARETKALERFKREIQIARKVTHPNVCRIFDVGYHVRDSARDEPERIAFVTMELLHGESLSARVQRVGPLSAPEATPIVLQLVNGLGAAHRLDIVHRDFKSANILLVRGDGTGATERAVITDFGLAQFVATSDSALPSLTTTGSVAGTPAYMAPEQIERGEITPSVDIYALGCVMYELVTGCLPFSGDTPFAVAIKRLSQPAPSPKELAPDLDPRWEAVILRCLERKPEFRYERVADVAAELTSSGDVNTLRLSPAPRDEVSHRVREAATIPLEAATLKQRIPTSPKRVRLLTLLGVLGAATLAGIATWETPRRDSRPLQPVQGARISARPAAAILEPHARSARSENSWIGTALHSYLVLALEDTKMRVVRADEVARARTDLRLASAGRLSEDTLRALRTRLSAEHVVFGEYDVDSAGLVTLLVRVGDGEYTFRGNQSDLAGLGLAAARELRKRLGLLPPDTRVIHADAVFPQSAKAMRSYFEGLRLMRAHDTSAARAKFSEAITAEPNFSPARFALAETCAALGYDEEARSEAKSAVELATWVPRKERQWMQARRFDLSHDWARSVTAWSELAAAHPDEIEYGIRLAQAASAAGDPKRALQATAALRRLPLALAGDPRIDLADARTAEPMGDYGLKARSAARAAAAASARGARFFLAQARHMEGMAAHGTGKHDDALNAYSAARQLFAAVGARDDEGWVINAIAQLHVDQNDLSAAGKMLETALAIFESTGNRRNEASTLSDMAILSYRGGDFPGARRFWQRALARQHEAGDREGEAITLNNLGALVSELGDLEEARGLFERALAIGRGVGDRWGTANTLANLSRLLFATGELSRSRALLDEAVTLFQGVGNRQGLITALADSGALRLEEGLLADAAKELLESESLARRDGDKPGMARARARLAQVELEQGNLTQCARSVQEALAVAAEASDKPVQAEVMLIEAERLRIRGDRDAASKILARALGFRTDLGDVIGAARTNMASAALALDASNASSAAQLSTNARDLCRARHARLDEARAEMLLARAQIALGNVRAAKAASTRASAILLRHPSALRVPSGELAAALVIAGEGDPIEARRRARAVASDAHRKGWFRVCHEALTTLDHIGRGPGQAWPQESQIERELTAKGFAPARGR